MLLNFLRATNVIISLITLYPSTVLLINLFKETVPHKARHVHNSLIYLAIGIAFGAVSNLFIVFNAFIGNHANSSHMNVISILLRLAFLFAIWGLYTSRDQK